MSARLFVPDLFEVEVQRRKEKRRLLIDITGHPPRPKPVDNQQLRHLVYLYLTNRSVFNKRHGNVAIGQWDVSLVECFDGIFHGFADFNENINNWQVCRATSMQCMFAFCTKFNQPLDRWDVSSVANMDDLFHGCHSFNQPLASWDVSNCVTMIYMFQSCRAFNQPLTAWQFSSLARADNMFSNTPSFAQHMFFSGARHSSAFLWVFGYAEEEDEENEALLDAENAARNLSLSSSAVFTYGVLLWKFRHQVHTKLLHWMDDCCTADDTDVSWHTCVAQMYEGTFGVSCTKDIVDFVTDLFRTDFIAFLQWCVDIWPPNCVPTTSTRAQLNQPTNIHGAVIIEDLLALSARDTCCHFRESCSDPECCEQIRSNSSRILEVVMWIDAEWRCMVVLRNGLAQSSSSSSPSASSSSCASSCASAAPPSCPPLPTEVFAHICRFLMPSPSPMWDADRAFLEERFVRRYFNHTPAAAAAAEPIVNTNTQMNTW